MDVSGLSIKFHRSELSPTLSPSSVVANKLMLFPGFIARSSPSITVGGVRPDDFDYASGLCCSLTSSVEVLWIVDTPSDTSSRTLYAPGEVNCTVGPDS